MDENAMTRSASGEELAPFLSRSLLITESKAEFEQLSSMMLQEIEPRGGIEMVYVAEIIDTTWQTIRYQRSRTAMLNVAYRNALRNLLDHELEVVDSETADALAQQWFTTKEAREEVGELLRRFNLDESAIEAEAIKSLGAELERLDRMLTSLQSRRNRAIRELREYRESVAERARDVSRRVIEEDKVPPLEDSEESEEDWH
jgi:hypothetical protein